MFDYYRYSANSSATNHRRTDPQQVHLWVYSDGRARVQRRCNQTVHYHTPWARRAPTRYRPVYRVDRWYSSIEDVFPLLTAMTQGNRYYLDSVTEHLPPAVMTAVERAYHAECVKHQRRKFCVLDPMPF